ncbi:TetR family transcriptional regulator [Sciscionella sediminilitoris]|uniref:TetR family transcriptional regulator n=1 Tax=Sciscionella sediminilitoris TaxID=1445613 RepID=UPI0004DF2200|nr:TetR family transcriptional regulator [Sciscionella sp. SE31]
MEGGTVRAGPLRRSPVQQRSTERVGRMLDACADLLGEVGYEQLSTTAIAKRAGVAVGSLYQFFPDKRAVVQALTKRNLDWFVARAAEALDAVDHTHWWDVVGSVLDVYLHMHREVPGFARVHFGDVVDPQLLDENRDNNAVLVDALTERIAEHVDVPVEELRLTLTVANEAADALLKLAFRRDPAGEESLVAETKTLVKGYLAGKFGS